MTKKIFNTLKAPRMSDVFPQAVIANNLIFLSGTPGFDLATGKVVSDNFEAQADKQFFCRLR